MPTMTPDELANACARALWEGDRCSQSMGFSIEEVGPDRAVLTMTVTENMVNGHDICHGGVMFMLADSAFAFACNSRNVSSVAQHCAVTFLQPAGLGDVLTATASVRSSKGRNGVCDVTVTRGDEVIAEFRGNSRSLGSQLIETEENTGD